MKKITFILVCLSILAVAACTGTHKGTEVLNPQETVSVKITTGQFSINVLPGWKYVICANDPAGCPGAYTDPLGNAEALIVLTKSQSNFVILAGSLASGQSLVEYVDARHKPEDKVELNSEDGVDMAAVNQLERGTNGGSVMFIYGVMEGHVVVMRLEIMAPTVEEMQTIVDEFFAMGRTLTID